MNMQHLLLTAGWLIYCGLHSVLANETIKVKIGERLRLSMANYRLLYNIFALASLIALLIFHFSVNSLKLFDSLFLSKWIGPVVLGLGLTGMLICIFKYFRQLSGIREIQDTKQPVLETSGMHRFVRHPLYISTFVFLIGLFMLQPMLSNLIAVVIIIVYTIVAIKFEEEKLIKEFGDQYIEYKRKVPMLIPFGNKQRER